MECQVRPPIHLILSHNYSTPVILTHRIPFHFYTTYRGLGFCQYVADELRIKVFARVHQGFLDRHIGRDCTEIEGR